MCGIAGIVGGGLPYEVVEERVLAMRERLRHRGPDDEGLYVDAKGRCALGHARLSILDLSSAGHQPMSTTDGRYAIVFNGEIYNFRDLRQHLQRKGVAFRSTSDTEVLLRLYEREGAECVKRLDGMFAFAIWDSLERICFLGRDPLGIKPLYVWEHHGALAFASEVRALLKAGLGAVPLCPGALRRYLLFGSVQEPDTLIAGVRALPAGHVLQWRDGRSETSCYWRLSFNAVELLDGRPQEVASAALEQSVDRHFVSDVPVGIFLSGGLDSTALVALARRRRTGDLRTFSISFDEAQFNEGELAARTAKHFGTDHHDWRLTVGEGKSLVDSFLAALDQPSNDGFNTFCVSKLAHELGAKVVLSGLGGDELFGSYPTFRRIPKLLDLHRRLSMAGPVRRWLGHWGQACHGRNKFQRLGAFLRSEGGVNAAYWTVRGIFSPSEANQLVAAYVPAEADAGGAERGSRLVPLPPAGAEQVLASSSLGHNLDQYAEPSPQFPDVLDQVSYLETTRYMRNQLLRDSDVMSMAWGLELRVPLVDRRLVETVGRVPARVRCASGKRLMLQAVPEIPDWIAGQPKRGFRFPLQEWFTAEWKDVFLQMDRTCPVRLVTWYRRWTLFTLNHFLTTNGIDSALASVKRESGSPA